MGQRKKFNFGGNELNTREVSEEVAENNADNRAQELVNAIESAGVNTAFNFKLIPRNKLVFHEENDYPMEAIKELAESILNNGLLHNLDVYFDEDNDTYIIEAGEQRTRAIDSLIEEFKDYPDRESKEYQKYLINVHPFEKGYPCKVCSGSSKMKISDGLDEDSLKELDMVESKLRLRISNEVGREYDPVRTKKALDDIVKLENRRNELLGNEKKITNKELGAQLNITDRMVQKYKAIDKLIPELQDLFQEHGITLTDGANYANLNEEEQRQILNLINAGGNRKEVEALYAQLNEVQKEIKQKNEELQKLEREKAESIEKANRAKADVEALEEKIRVELQREISVQNEADKHRVKELETQLKDANKNVAAYEAQKKELQARCEEIEELKLQLAQKSKPANSEKNIESVRAALRVEGTIKALENAFKELQKGISEYQEVYDGAETSKSPDEYSKEIIAILGKFEKIF